MDSHIRLTLTGTTKGECNCDCNPHSKCSGEYVGLENLTPSWHMGDKAGVNIYIYIRHVVQHMTFVVGKVVSGYGKIDREKSCETFPLSWD